MVWLKKQKKEKKPYKLSETGRMAQGLVLVLPQPHSEGGINNLRLRVFTVSQKTREIATSP